MLASTPTYHLEGVGNTRIALTEDHLRMLFSRIEAELHHSEVYQRALQYVQHGAENAQQEFSQNILKAVGREAIRLAMRQIVRQHRAPTPLHAVPQPAPTPVVEAIAEEPSAAIAHLPAPEVDEAPAAAPEPVMVITQAATDEPQAIPVAEVAVVKPKTHRRAVSAKEKAQEQKEQRAEVLRQIGAQLRQARVTKGYSLEQLHQLTWVPVYQLKSLEEGEVNRLPEDVYIHGFIRRVAEVLNLDVSEVLTPFAQRSSERPVVPSWQRPQAVFRPVHLYVGYAALMTGALGGLVWLSNEANEMNSLEPSPSVQLEPSTTAPLAPTTGSAQVNAMGSIANPEMVPPEASF